MAERPSLSTAEAAARLGVKPATVYAYVSRGLITRHLADDGRTSRLDAADVERMARRGRRTATRRSALDVVLTTAITRLDESSLRYRGHDPAQLATRHPYESVARLLWVGRLEDGPMTVGEDVARPARAVVAALAPDTPLLDRLRVVAAVVGAADPYRGDTRPARSSPSAVGSWRPCRPPCRRWARRRRSSSSTAAATRVRWPSACGPASRRVGAGPVRCGR